MIHTYITKLNFQGHSQPIMFILYHRFYSSLTATYHSSIHFFPCTVSEILDALIKTLLNLVTTWSLRCFTSCVLICANTVHLQPLTLSDILWQRSSLKIHGRATFNHRSIIFSIAIVIHDGSISIPTVEQTVLTGQNTDSVSLIPSDFFHSSFDRLVACLNSKFVGL